MRDLKSIVNSEELEGIHLIPKRNSSTSEDPIIDALKVISRRINLETEKR